VSLVHAPQPLPGKSTDKADDVFQMHEKRASLESGRVLSKTARRSRHGAEFMVQTFSKCHMRAAEDCKGEMLWKTDDGQLDCTTAGAMCKHNSRCAGVSSENRKCFLMTCQKILPSFGNCVSLWSMQYPISLLDLGLPKALVDLSNALLPPKKAHEALSHAAPIKTIHSLGQIINVTSLHGDDSVSRLQEEFGAGADHKDEYGLQSITTHEPLILDVGGNIGFLSIVVQKKHPASQVVVFEPNPTTYFFLRVNLWLNGIHVITSEELQQRPKVAGVYPVFGGLGRASPFELLRIPVSGARRSQNFQTDGGSVGAQAVARGQAMPVYNLRAFLAAHGLTSRVFDLVKLDCECCEYNVVPDSRDWLVNKELVRGLAGEVHPCGDPGAQKSTLDILRSRGCIIPDKNLNARGHLTWVVMLQDACHQPPPSATAIGHHRE